MASFLTDKRGYSFDQFELEVQMGKVKGARIEWHIASTNTNANGVMSTVCYAQTGIHAYNFGYGIDADTITISSTNALDNGINVVVVGLDADGYEQQEVVAIGGTTANTWSRFFGSTNVDSTEFIGVVTAHKTTGMSLEATFSVIDQRTLCGVYTIPKGKRGFLTAGELSLGSGKEAQVYFKVRPQGKVFTTAQKVSIYQTVFRAERPRNAIPELTDIEVRIIPTSNDLEFSVTFGIIILDVTEFNLEGL